MSWYSIPINDGSIPNSGTVFTYGYGCNDMDRAGMPSTVEVAQKILDEKQNAEPKKLTKRKIVLMTIDILNAIVGVCQTATEWGKKVLTISFFKDFRLERYWILGVLNIPGAVHRIFTAAKRLYKNPYQSDKEGFRIAITSLLSNINLVVNAVSTALVGFYHFFTSVKPFTSWAITVCHVTAFLAPVFSIFESLNLYRAKKFNRAIANKSNDEVIDFLCEKMTFTEKESVAIDRLAHKFHRKPGADWTVSYDKAQRLFMKGKRRYLERRTGLKIKLSAEELRGLTNVEKQKLVEAVRAGSNRKVNSSKISFVASLVNMVAVAILVFTSFTPIGYALLGGVIILMFAKIFYEANVFEKIENGCKKISDKASDIFRRGYNWCVA